ncbi:MAG: hypothetical protein QGG73_13000 [Candidatus Hydrogenedentes bacterium]|jgi:hypothetical protein|nr:hypothetical protein [Candidatus Hydrogenedentota bacterium]
MDAETLVWVGLVVLNLLAFYYMRRLFFRSCSDFGEAVRYWFTPDMWSWFDGDLAHDMWAEFKLGLYATSCAALAGAESLLFMPLIGKFS